MNLGNLKYSGMSSSILDAEYSDAYMLQQASSGSGKVVASGVLNEMLQEILNRKATPLGFLDSLMTSFVGGSAFPKFDAIQKQTGGFVSSEVAASSIEQSASNVVATVEHGVKSVMSTGLIAGSVVAVLAVLYLFKRK
jgi:hypothetical protein